MNLSVVSPIGTIYQDTVDEISLPTPKGEITILPHHVSLFTKMAEGVLNIKKGSKESIIATVGGFVEVHDGNVVILSDHLIKAENIQAAKAQEAKRRAEETMKKKESEVDFVMAEKELQKAIMELNVADKIKRKQKYQ